MSDPIDARLTLRIPRGSQQDLREEARERLARVDAVERVEAFDVTGVRPGLNDLRVRAEATVVCGPGAETSLDVHLSQAVGIERVERRDESER
ncbi:hypothetical protein [Salinigranum halophilum]|jgi:hypothetical protein|uniref:hypothetical protein n=1 Tax=Salinigranum halophilum TaxID=2565931 RepID=UPI00115F0677|nr:hypothetical protein [Salinigranum halophilum]